jgi:hypothetical protein
VGALSQAFYDRLAGDGTLTALLSTYEGAPAVFTNDPAPPDAVLPFVVTAGEFAVAPFDTKTRNGRTVYRDVRCYAKELGSAEQIEDIAERVRALFHRYALPVGGFTTVLCDVSGPTPAPDDDETVTGRIVSVRLVIQEELGS